jgi:hypothetical protein
MPFNMIIRSQEADYMKKTLKTLGNMAIGAAAALLIFGAVSVATSGDPGTSTDPVVTKSFVEKRLSEVVASLTQKIDALSAKIGSGGTASPGAPPAFVVIELQNGDKITFGENTQVILRGGAASAIAAANDLPDVTGGTGLALGQTIPLNHLIIIPKSDGRGMSIKDRSWLMISGQYTVMPAAQ